MSKMSKMVKPLLNGVIRTGFFNFEVKNCCEYLENDYVEILVERGGKYWIMKFCSGFECFLLDNEIVPIGCVFCTGKVDGLIFEVV